jgi:amidase
MTFDPASIRAHADRLGVTVSHAAAALACEQLADLEGAWRDQPSADRSRPVSRDPLGAVARVIERKPKPSGPLSGMRLAVKDNIAVANIATSMGLDVPGFCGSEDATVVGRADAAGATIVAKAQCEALLLGANSFTSQPAPVRNPHDPSRSAGGSSSGSGAMVAAQLCDAAFGTDSGGSIRIPAAYCGVVGLKPSRGMVPFTGIAPLAPWLEVAGPMARTVADVASLFNVIAGRDGRDPRCGLAMDTRSEAGSPANDGGFRIGIFDAPLAKIDAAVADAIAAAIGLAIAQGVRTTSFDWDGMDAALSAHLAVYVLSEALTATGRDATVGASAPHGWAEWRAALSPETIPEPTQLSIATGLALHDADPGLLTRAIRDGMSLARSLDAALGDLDAIILPVTGSVAPLHPSGAPAMDEIYGDTRFTAPFNLTGHPAIALPVGTVGGLPVATQLVGHRGQDRCLLEIADHIERAVGAAALPIGDFGRL